MLHSSSSSAQAGRLSLPACAEVVVQDGDPSERQSLSARQAADRGRSPTVRSVIWKSLVYDGRVLESLISALIERRHKIGITHGCSAFDA
jgi:hypothetical protein